MTVLKKDAHLVPVWGAKYRVVSGLDPLGMQNASEAAFAALLPGITNLTNHIRFYGLYCWLLDTYSRHERHTSRADQNRFLRRAEFTISLMMGHMAPEVIQVPGSDYAKEQLAKDEETFDLEELADKDGEKKTYWKYSSGAYGQYYTGAMREIGLNLISTHGNFICSRPEDSSWNGTRMAAVFRANITDKAAELMLRCVETGRVTRVELEELYEQFSLVPVPLGTEEWNAYAELLKDVDRPIQLAAGREPSLHRRRTIRHLLRYMALEDEDALVFTELIHAGHGEYRGETDDTLSGWYYYQSNEYWHYGAGACHWGALNWLEEQGSIYPWNDWVPALTKELVASLKRLWKVKPIDQVSKVIGQLPHLLEISSLLAEQRRPDRDSMALGLGQVLALYDHDGEHLGKLRQAMLALGAERDGNALSGMDWITERLDLSIEEFVSAFLRHWVIHRHQHVALRKLAGSGSFTLKFIVEEGMVRLIQVFEPQYTSPRLVALEHMLQDMSMLDSDGAITPLGRNYLEQIEP